MEQIETKKAQFSVAMGDQEIIQLFFQRCEEAVTQTQKKYGALCRSVAQRLLSDPRDTEECVSDTYLRAWNAIPPERPRSLRAYLARITRNLALDRYKYNTAAQRSTALTDAFEELEPWIATEQGDPDTELDASELRRVLNGFLRRQSAEARVFFLRRYWYGESIREIAEECCVSEANAFQMEREYQEEVGISSIDCIDGYDDFVFVNRFGMVQSQSTLNKAIKRIMRDCNGEILDNAVPGKEPTLLPDFSCHSLRHTFATRLCESGTNIKVIQDVLGHADVSTTMNIYVDVTNELKKNELKSFSAYMEGA